MKGYLKRMILVLSILVSLWGGCFGKADAQSGFDFYFFGQNLKSFDDSNWLKVALGATASLFVHELGHVAALELAGKSWDFQASFPSGFAVYTDEHLDSNESLNLGRAGFAVQSFVGFVLTSFESTRSSDYTKGWVSMNAFQIHSYRVRSHSIGDDFAMIDKGGGNADLEFAAFSLLSLNNMLRLEADPWTNLTQSFFNGPVEPGDLLNPIDNVDDIYIEEIDRDFWKPLLPIVEMSGYKQQEVLDRSGMNGGASLFAKNQSTSKISTSSDTFFNLNFPKGESVK